MDIAEYERILEFTQDERLWEFMKRDLYTSLSSIGYSDELLADLLNKLRNNFNIPDFIQRHSNELYEVHSVGFFQKIAPEFQRTYIIPVLPTGGLLLM